MAAVAPSVCPNWDNTPRLRGGLIMVEGTPEKFGAQLRHRYEQDKNSEFIFVNAWNEWGEQAVLEPSDLYGYGFLEQLSFFSSANSP